MSDDTLLLLNRALLVMQTMRASAHELNNVFQMIGGSAELLDLNPDFPAAMRPKLATIARHTGRGRTLVAAAADLARAEPPRAAVADVKKTIERVAQLRNYEHVRSGIEMVVHGAADEPLVVRADPFDLQVMLLNLVIDAERAVASAPQKTITIATGRDGARGRVIVADRGVRDEGGELVTSLPTGPETPFSVTGLALAATRLLAARHGGTMERRQSGGIFEVVLVLPL